MTADVLSDEQYAYIERWAPPSMGGVEQCCRAYALRREHMPRSRLAALYGVSEATVRRAVRVVAEATGNYRPAVWAVERHARRTAMRGRWKARISPERQAADEALKAEHLAALEASLAAQERALQRLAVVRP